jgi:general secretion pathway protein D
MTCTFGKPRASIVLMRRRFPFVRRTVPAIFALVWLCGAAEDSPREQAMALAKKARRAEKSGHNADAYILYSEAAAIETQNPAYRAKMQVLQSRAALEAKATPAEAENAGAGAETPLTPEDVFDSLTARELARDRQPREPPALQGKPGLQNLDLTGNARTIFDQVAQRFGLETVYDGDYPTAGQQIRLQISGVDYREALHALEAASGSFVIPLSSRVFMVAQDTPQKRNDLEQSIVVSVPVPQALTAQELTEIGQAVKQATNVDKLGLDTAQGQIVIRDRISRALPAQALLQQLFAWRPEIMMEIEFLEVTDSDIVNYGFNLTNSVPAFYLGQILHNVPSVPKDITNLVTFGGGKTLIGLGVMQAQALFNQSVSSGRSLYRSQVRSVDGQAATFHAGEKFPVVTSGYYGSVPSNLQSQVYSPPPSYTYEDLGVVVKITPHVHGDSEVTLAVETSFEVLTGQSVNGIPVIGRRQLNTQVRLRDSEWAVVAGLIGRTDSRAQNGFWGLSQVPLFGDLFRQTTKDKENESVLVAIKPHLLSLPPDQMLTHPVRVGTETRPFTPL